MGSSWAVYLAILLNLQVIMQSLAVMQLGSFVFPWHRQLTKKLSSTDILLCSVLKNGRAFLGTLALDSNCFVWCTCVVLIVGALNSIMWYIYHVNDCSFSFFFHFFFLFPSYFSIVLGIFCTIMKGGPGTPHAQLKLTL